MKRKSKRDILKKAEAAISDESLKRELKKNGINIGEPIEMSGTEFLEMIQDEDNGDSRPSITIIFYEKDTPLEKRDEIEDALCELIEGNDLGEWNGGGSGDLGSGPMFDMNFIVNDLERSLGLVKSKLIQLGVGQKTEITYEDKTIKVFQ